jgi:Rieske Fe-S protein
MCMSVNGGASRRAVLLGASAVGAATALAACGGEEPSGPRQPAPVVSGGGGTTAGGGTTGGAADGIPAAEIPVGGGRVYSDRWVVVTQPEAGQFRAFDASCTHEGCMVVSVEAGMINCVCHGSQFRIADGSVARGPATRPLPPRTATVTDDVIVIS